MVSQVKPQEVKAAKPASAKKEAKLPTYAEMVVDAVKALNERKGSTVVMIRNQIAKHHPDRPGADRSVLHRIKQAIDKLKSENKLVEAKREAGSKDKPRLKLSDSTKKELKAAITPKKTPAKKAAAKKSPAAKKSTPAAKKTTGAKKSTTTAAKKTAPKTTPVKKAAKENKAEASNVEKPKKAAAPKTPKKTRTAKA